MTSPQKTAWWGDAFHQQIDPVAAAHREWKSAYYLFRLAPLLYSLDCEPALMERILRWFNDKAIEWAPRCVSEKDFNAVSDQRVKDRVRYERSTRNAALAEVVLSKLFVHYDRTLQVDDILKAVGTLCPPQAFPFPTIVNNGSAIVQIESSRLHHTLLTVDAEFLPILETLYPFKVAKGNVTKVVPLQKGGNHSLDLAVVAFWWAMRLHPAGAVCLDELKKGVAFKNGDAFDWRATNVYSKWREGKDYAAHQQKADAVPTDKNDIVQDAAVAEVEAGGMPDTDISKAAIFGEKKLRARRGRAVTSEPGLLETAADSLPAKPTAAAEPRNKFAPDTFDVRNAIVRNPNAEKLKT
jgi:hypothetical protein